MVYLLYFYQNVAKSKVKGAIYGDAPTEKYHLSRIYMVSVEFQLIV